MTPADVAALILSILAGLAAVFGSLAALIQAFRVRVEMQHVRRDLNGRLDELLKEREERVRTEALLHAARQKLEALPSPPAVGRADPFVRRFPPEKPEGESDR